MIRVTLSNSAGEKRDSFTAPDIGAAEEEISNLLLHDDWLLEPGDRIEVAEVEG